MTENKGSTAATLGAADDKKDKTVPGDKGNNTPTTEKKEDDDDRVPGLLPPGYDSDDDIPEWGGYDSESDDEEMEFEERVRSLAVNDRNMTPGRIFKTVMHEFLNKGWTISQMPCAKKVSSLRSR